MKIKSYVKKPLLLKKCFFLSAAGIIFISGVMYGTTQQKVTSKTLKESLVIDSISGVDDEDTTSTNVLDNNATKRNDNKAGDVKDPMGNPNAQERISFFKETAKSFNPFTDKIGNSQDRGHRYHNMYGNFLLPLAASKPTFKFLEIGMGCGMKYGPGASVKLWKKLFPEADIWEAEHNEKCVGRAKQNNQLEGINTLVGDQGDFQVLDKWIEQSGGKFDVIIDDGGHTNCQISHSFEKLWPELNPGGYYFIEDLQVGHKKLYQDCDGLVMGDLLKDWQQQLIFEEKRMQPAGLWKYPLPKDLIFVHCQPEACVLGKYHSEINDIYVKPKNK